MTTVPAPTTWTGAAVARAKRPSRVPDLLVLLFVFVFYTNLAVVLTRFHGVPQIVASGVAVLLFVPIVKYLVIERRPVVVTPVLPLFLLFLGALFLSGTLSREPDVVREAIDIYLTEGLLLYLLVSNAVRTTRMLTMVVWTLIAAASMLGALSIVQELTHTYENNYGGFAQVDRLDVGGNFNIAPDAEEKELRPRLGGPLGSENRYAQILAVIFPFALIRAFRDPRRRFRLFGAGASVLIAGGVILSFSRGAAVALAATIVLMVLFRELKFRHVALALAALTAVVLVAFPHYLIRIGSLEKITSLSAAETTTDGPDSAIVGRQTENLAAWNTFLDHPLVGVGPGAYFHEYSREYANRLGVRYLESDRRGHSLYLEMAADLGMIGLGAFAAMVGAALLLLRRAMRYWRRLDPERAILASSLFFGLVAYLATAAFLHLSYQRYFWILLALASSAIWTLRQEQRGGTETPSTAPSS